MTTFDWAEIRASAVKRFRDAPDAALEQRILDVFREHPALVVEGVAHVSARYAKGDIAKPWVILAMHVEQAVTPLENVQATDTRDRGKATSRAGQWMRAAGKHFDDEAELVDELFGDFGQLRPWAGEERIRAKMLELWREVRPEGELIDTQAEERAERWQGMRDKARSWKPEQPEPVLPSGEPESDDDIPF